MGTHHRPPPRVLIANGPSGFANAGDVALLQAMVQQLEGLWPGCRINVLTSEPELGARHWPHLCFLPLAEHRVWTGDRRWLAAVWRRLPLPLRWRAEALERAASDAWTLALIRRPWLRPLALGRDRQSLGRLIGLMRQSDLVLGAGGGTHADVFAEESWARLCVLRLAQDLGLPTAMLSQGLGPLTLPRLRRLAAATWARVGLIALREQRRGPELLRRLGVELGRVVISGDDAIALALAQGSAELGHHLGFNLRVSGYAGVTEDHLRIVGQTVGDFSRRQGCPLLGFAISARAGEEDQATLRRCIPDLPVEAGAPSEVSDPGRVIAEVGRCRLVVTGSYHGAVFALAQGIPAIGLAASEYYRDKFLGLADMFGTGCRVVRLDAPQAPGELADALDHLWTDAPRCRPGLLDSARRQARMAREAYQRLARLLPDPNPSAEAP